MSSAFLHWWTVYKKKIYDGIYNGQFKNKMNSLKLCVGDEMIIMCIYEFMSYFSNFMSWLMLAVSKSFITHGK